MIIDKGTYQGYLWYSDQSEPTVFDNEPFELEIADNNNPFIAEGMLYDQAAQKSITIRYTDGKYIMMCHNLSELKSLDHECHTYLAHRMGDRWLKFVECWRPEADPLCEGMEVLQPAETVFMGFTTKEE